MESNSSQSGALIHRNIILKGCNLYRADCSSFQRPPVGNLRCLFSFFVIYCAWCCFVCLFHSLSIHFSKKLLSEIRRKQILLWKVNMSLGFFLRMLYGKVVSKTVHVKDFKDWQRFDHYVVMSVDDTESQHTPMYLMFCFFTVSPVEDAGHHLNWVENLETFQNKARLWARKHVNIPQHSLSHLCPILLLVFPLKQSIYYILDTNHMKTMHL